MNNNQQVKRKFLSPTIDILHKKVAQTRPIKQI